MGVVRRWRRLLLTIEHKLGLADKYPGMLADELSDYLYTRSTGHFASLMTLIARGCLRAIRCGQERLSMELMDKVSNDAAAEDAGRNSQADRQMSAQGSYAPAPAHWRGSDPNR